MSETCPGPLSIDDALADQYQDILEDTDEEALRKAPVRAAVSPQPGERDPALRIAKYDESLADADLEPDILRGTSVWALGVAAITCKRSLAT